MIFLCNFSPIYHYLCCIYCLSASPHNCATTATTYWPLPTSVMNNLMTKAILHPLPAVIFLIINISRWAQLTPFHHLLPLPRLYHPFNNILPFNYGTISDLVLVNSPDAMKVSAPAMHTIVQGRQIRGRGWTCCCCGSSLWVILPGHPWIYFCWWRWVTMRMGKIYLSQHF